MKDLNPISQTRIDEELVCVDSLRNTLLTRCGCLTVSIRREENDPPDFTVAIDGVDFAAEVTSVTSKQQYHADIKRLASEVESQMTRIGTLDGTYCILVTRSPQIPRPQSAARRKLVQSAMEFILSSQVAAETSEELLLRDAAKSALDRIVIRKLSTGKAAVVFSWTPEAKWEGEVERELTAIIAKCISAKIGSLAEGNCRRESYSVTLRRVWHCRASCSSKRGSDYRRTKMVPFDLLGCVIPRSRQFDVSE